jgi:hypothetical protein
MIPFPGQPQIISSCHKANVNCGFSANKAPGRTFHLFLAEGDVSHFHDRDNPKQCRPSRTYSLLLLARLRLLTLGVGAPTSSPTDSRCARSFIRPRRLLPGTSTLSGRSLPIIVKSCWWSKIRVDSMPYRVFWYLRTANGKMVTKMHEVMKIGSAE